MLGFRLNTILAFEALSDVAIDRWVCWDPVTSGRVHYSEIRRMSREKATKLLVTRNLLAQRTSPDWEQLVGTTFSIKAIRELLEMRVTAKQIPKAADICQLISGSLFNSDEERTLWKENLGEYPATRVFENCEWYWSPQIHSSITHKSIIVELQQMLTGDGT